MDITRFVKSKAIKDHLEKTEYAFSTPEAAFLVYQSDRPLREKHEAWEQIIRELPDCSMEERLNMNKLPSIHVFLQEYMELEDRQVTAFTESDTDAVFTYLVHYPEDDRRENLGWADSQKLFKTYSECFEHILLFETSDDMDLIRIKKVILNPEEDHWSYHIEMTVNAALEPVSLRYFGTLSEEEYDILSAFEGMWFAIPTPFKRGDILAHPNFGPFVLENLPCWNGRDYLNNGFSPEWINHHNVDRLFARLSESGDVSDMHPVYIDYSLDGGIYLDHCPRSYLELEYYTGSLEGKDRCLSVLKQFLQSKSSKEDFGFAVNSLAAISMEAEINERLHSLPGMYTKESLNRVGL